MIIEIDENKRMMEIFESLGNRLIIFLRFNPDKYENNQGMFWFTKLSKVKETKEFQSRFDKLTETIQYWLDNKPEKDV